MENKDTLKKIPYTTIDNISNIFCEKLEKDTLLVSSFRLYRISMTGLNEEAILLLSSCYRSLTLISSSA